MKRLASATLFGAVAVLLGASPARAQYVYFGGGVNLPMSTFKDVSKTGWIASAGVGANVGTKGLWIEGEGWYGSNKAKGTSGAKTDLWSALGVVGYDLMHDKKVTPYIAGGAGVLHAKGGKTKLAYTGAFGLGYKSSEKVLLFLEGRWLASTGTGSIKMVPITVGVSIHFGNKKM